MTRAKNLSLATREVTAESDAQIEAKTAKAWLARALACRAEYTKTRDLNWLLRYKGYADEALEHAAMVRDGGKTVIRVERALKKHKKGRY